MEDQVTCKDCELCRLDLTRKVKIGEKINDNEEMVEKDCIDMAYCGHKVILVGLNYPVCNFFRKRKF